MKYEAKKHIHIFPLLPLNVKTRYKRENKGFDMFSVFLSL